MVYLPGWKTKTRQILACPEGQRLGGFAGGKIPKGWKPSRGILRLFSHGVPLTEQDAEVLDS